MKTGEEKTNILPQNPPEGPDAISKEKLAKILNTELTKWRESSRELPDNILKDTVQLYREYKFKSFSDVMEFMNKIAVACDLYPHHPTWQNTWRSLKVWLATWDSSLVISYKDIMMARLMDRVYKEYEINEEEEINWENQNKKQRIEFADSIIELIKKNDYNTAFKHLNKFTILNPEYDKINEITILMSRWSRTRDSILTNTINRADADIAFNKIGLDMLQLVTDWKN